jgi:hypothetical protein
MSSAARGPWPKIVTAMVIPCALCVPQDALAGDDRAFWTFGPSLLFSHPAADSPGLGAEVSLMRHSRADWENLFCLGSCWGVLLQAESKPSIVRSRERAFRASIAGQGSLGPLVGELGPAVERHPSSGSLYFGAQLGAFVSVGFASLGARASMYPGRLGDQDGGVELAFVVRGTIPVLFPVMYVPHSRRIELPLVTRELGRFPM